VRVSSSPIDRIVASGLVVVVVLVMAIWLNML
jgi:hypothetical protein